MYEKSVTHSKDIRVICYDIFGNIEKKNGENLGKSLRKLSIYPGEKIKNDLTSGHLYIIEPIVIGMANQALFEESKGIVSLIHKSITKDLEFNYKEETTKEIAQYLRKMFDRHNRLIKAIGKDLGISIVEFGE